MALLGAVVPTYWGRLGEKGDVGDTSGSSMETGKAPRKGARRGSEDEGAAIVWIRGAEEARGRGVVGLVGKGSGSDKEFSVAFSR